MQVALSEIISLPQAGGAQRGIGETFIPDLQTGTGNLTVPIVVPAGRRHLQPTLDLTYSTGNGNGHFGLGWQLGIPGISRRTGRGVPTYRAEEDTFVLSGAEELVLVERLDSTRTRYRPRTEGLFARILHHRAPADGDDFWEVVTTDGLRSVYGTARQNGPGPDPAVVADPDDPARIFAWRLTSTRDSLGNIVAYEYGTDAGDAGSHRWRQPMLRAIRYVDHVDAGGARRYFAAVTLDDEPRADAFSSYSAGFEIRTSRRYRSITTSVTTTAERAVRRYDLSYGADAHTGVSLLTAVQVVGFDDSGGEHRDLAPVTFGYRRFRPEDRRFRPVTGPDPPPPPSDPNLELVDLTGDGTPDVLQLNGVARYWPNAGGGAFNRPRVLADAPAGVALADPQVALLDIDGDGCADLLVSWPSEPRYVPLRFGPSWGAVHHYRQGPTFSLADPQVRLLDLTGDGVTDALDTGAGAPRCYFSDPVQGWTGPRAATGPDLPDFNVADPRVRWADMTGDGLTDLVLLHGRTVDYWPNLGRGRFGRRVRMAAVADLLPDDATPERLLLGDLDGDGLADLVHVGADQVRIWFNRSGNGWSTPVTIRGLPVEGWDVRIIDLLGSGTGGLLASRAAPEPGRPAMYFLDLVAGVTPRLLAEIDNHIGAVTRINYRSSASYATEDAASPATKWRTSLPFPVPVVAAVETVDQISGGRLSSAFRYRHGYWDGREREFRGFGRVEQTDTTTAPVDAPASWSPPTVTRTWFHLGVADSDGAGHLDFADEWWPGDPPLLDQPGRVRAFLAGLRTQTGAFDLPARRDAVRALRGRVMRTELYGLDGSSRAAAPYTVTEYSYELREEPSAVGLGRHRVFSVLAVRSRTTQWERGTDPMTTFTFTGGHDAFGQPGRETTVAAPRRSLRRKAVTAAAGRTVQPDETAVLATHNHTSYAVPDQGLYLHDRVADVRRYELRVAPGVGEPQPGDVRAVLAAQYTAAESVAAVFDALDPAQVRPVGHTVHHYDGPAYVGRGIGEVGPSGLLTRTETLVLTDELLDDVHGNRRPSYLGGTEDPPPGAPPGFGTGLGYRRQVGSAGGYLDGWYVDSVSQAYDVQLGTGVGAVVGMRDVLGHETAVTPDQYRLYAAAVRDPAGLSTTATYNYRAGRPERIVDPNGTTTYYRYHPLGMLAAVFRTAADGRGGTADRPEIAYTYRLASAPISVHTARRVAYASDGPDDLVESREYSDGIGRLVQKRTQADDLAFGTAGDDVGLLVADPAGARVPVPGRAGGPAVGARRADQVVVSGWQVYDDKGRVVEAYRPFLDTGWDFPAQPSVRGRPTSTRYDPRGHPVRMINPDGSQRRTVLGVPAGPAQPDAVDPTPWVVTAYDENDLAPLTVTGGVEPGAPAEHHFTPTTTVLDALGRAICVVTHVGTGPPVVTQSTYDLRGNPRALVDELGRTAATHQYDLLDRELLSDSIDAGSRIRVLDGAGNAVSAEDSRGCVELRTYDALGRLSAELARDGPAGVVTLRSRFEYGDAGDPGQPASERAAARAAGLLGRLRRRWDEAGVVTIEAYDLAGTATETIRRVISDAAIAAAEPDGWTANWAAPDADNALDPTEYRTSTQYDALSRPVRILAPTDMTGHRAELLPQYAPSGALRSMTVDGQPRVRLLAHDALGQRVLAALGNGLVTRYTYDPLTRRLTRLRTEPMTSAGDTWTTAGGTLQDFTYSYDLVGNVTTIEERIRGCGVAGSADGRDVLVRRMGYDPRYRLLSATGRACADIGTLRPLADAPRCGSLPTAPAPINAPEVTTGYRESYTYDPTGSLLDLFYEVTTGAAAPSWHRAHTIDPATNRLLAVRTGAATTTFRHDSGGNTTSQNDDRTYTWDHAGRLAGVRVHAGAATSMAARYLYGADGRRVKKWVRRGDSAALDESTTYIGTLAEHHRWARAGGGEQSLLHVMDGARRVAVIRSGPPHPDDAGPAVRFELADHLGSASVTVDDAGTFVHREEYFPYGETSFGSFARKRYRHTGTERDTETGLAYHGARYYDPALCRWLSPDPAGTVDSINRYVFAKDTPLVLADPSGRQARPPDEPKAARPPTQATTKGEVNPGPSPPGTKADGSTDWWWVANETLSKINPFESHETRVQRVSGVLQRYGSSAADADANAEQMMSAWGMLGKIAGAYGASKLLGPVIESLLVPAPVPGAGSVVLPKPPPVEPVAPEPPPTPKTYGPYYHTPQTVEQAGEIVKSGELWGAPPRNIFQSNSPAAKAATEAGMKMGGGPTPGRTVEFYTETPPNVGEPTSRWNFWEIRLTPTLEPAEPIPPGLRLGTHPTTGQDIAILIIKLARIM